MSRNHSNGVRDIRFAIVLLLTALADLLVPVHPARAVPAFATQTGLACTTCHVGAFGPQLTPFGRAFKITGYTQRGGEGLASEIPFSAMAMGSFTNVGKSYPSDAVPQHYNNNNNVSLDQISGFIAGGIGSHTGGFIQFTYSDFDNTFVLDNTDLRPYVTTVQAFGNDLVLGMSVNNNPSVQDPVQQHLCLGLPVLYEPTGDHAWRRDFAERRVCRQRHRRDGLCVVQSAPLS